jgi:hypothetical protein
MSNLEEFDAARNPCVRECLVALDQLHARFLKNNIGESDCKNLVQLALSERFRVKKRLDEGLSQSDYDALALSAMQEALRTSIRPGVAGFEVSIEDVGKAMGNISRTDLWKNFFAQYIGNIFEWRLNAADTDLTAEEVQAMVASLRREEAPRYAEDIVKSLMKRKKSDAHAALECLAEVLAGE